MKALSIAVKTLKEAVRQPRILAITLGLPVVFMVIFGLAFGGGDENEPYDLLVVNQDEGTHGATYVENLAKLQYDDGSPLVAVTSLDDEEDARRLVQSRDAAGFLVIPANFTEGLTPTEVQTPGALPMGPGGTRPGPPPGASVRLLGDPGYSRFAALSRIVDSYTRAFAEEASGQPAPVRVEEEQVTSQELDEFDFIAPGLMVFAVLNMVPQAAGALAREAESGTLDRVRQSPTRALELLGGVTLAQLAIAAVSMALMLLSARLMGFHNQGSYLVAYAIVMGAAVASVGIGMIVAALAKRQDEAANLAMLVSVPASFLSGSFFPLPNADFLTLGTREVGLYDLLPTTHAVDALRSVLTFGRDLDAAAWSLGALAVLGALFFTVGVLLYRRTRLAPA